MADDKARRGGADRKLIALTEAYEVAYCRDKLLIRIDGGKTMLSGE